MAREHGVRIPDFVTSREEEPGTVGRDERDPAQELLNQLAAITPGKGGWTQFEKFCETLLVQLFCPPLSHVITQSSNENGVNRRDFIMPNYAPDGFWQFMRVHYRADFVVAEGKNYTKPVSKNEVLQLANYLTHHGTGLVGVLLTRTGLDSAARWTCREQWLLHNKLIIGLDDGDYRQMLSTAQAGGDPSELIRQRIEDFRLRI